MKNPSVAVLGAGNWGTTVAQLIASNGRDVTLWCRSEAQQKEIAEKRTNEKYLKGVSLSPRIHSTCNLTQAVRGAALLFFVIPSKAFREVARTAGDYLEPDQLIVHGTKGLEAKTHKRMSEILLEETCVRQIGVLSGPNIAPEICEGKPAGTVIASKFPRVIERATEVLLSDRFRVYSNEDVTGVELGGALKNIVALAAGMAAEMKLGENSKALLVTRGLSEIARLGVALGARAFTFAGMAGLGDLLVTCSSPLSRNHQVGVRLARGEKLPEILEKLGMVAEGVNTSKAAHEIAAERGLDLPLFEGIYRIVHKGLSPAKALEELMTLSSRHDVDRTLG
ncbi:MAG: NAD(P)H-dependent glycerol-3-phosphate dehydrogenase [Bdellovibrionota bacterium]